VRNVHLEVLMRRSFAVAFVAILSALSGSLLAQQGTQASVPPARDQQAVSILTQVLSAAGGLPAIAAVLDFKATGNVTYFWAGEDVTGTTTIKGRGTDQFRIDSDLSSGKYTLVVSKGSGQLKDIRGRTIPISFANAVNKGNLIFPLAEIAARFQDPTVGIAYVGLVTLDGRQVHQISTRRILTSDTGHGQLLNTLTTRDFFIDPQTFQVVATLDKGHPDNADQFDFPHQMLFSGYQTVNGILVPFSITERIAGQTTWTIQLSQISFNAGLGDTDFQH
jgi:hypothetical protein